VELEIGDLVSHKIHKDLIGYGIVLTSSVPMHGTYCCSVQWIQTGYIHTMDVDVLHKIKEDKK
jgi:hypothetical protein